MQWSLRTRLAFLGGLVALAVVFLLFWIERKAEQKRIADAAAREQETKKLQERIDTLTKQLDDANQWHPDVRNLGQGGPIPAPAVDTSALARARLLKFRQDAKHVVADLDRLEKEVSAWNARLKALLTNEEGKRFASNKTHVEQIATVAGKDRMDLPKVAGLREQWKALVEPIEKLAENPTDAPYVNDGLFQGLNELSASTRSAIREFEQDSAVFEALGKDAEKQELSKSTLEQALANLISEKARERAAMIAAAKQKVIDDQNKKLADLQAKAAQDLANIELQKAKEKATSDLLKQEAELATIKEARKREELEIKFKAALPEINRHLAVFTAKGYSQPKSFGCEKTGTLGPMSYSKIVGYGALREGRPGMERLMSVASVNNDRYKGNFPMYSGSTANWNKTDTGFLARVQELLSDFGPIMVEKGLLAP